MSDATRTHPGRRRLIAWKAAKPDNFYTAWPLLRRVLERMHPGAFDHRGLLELGAAMAGPVDAAAAENDLRFNHPRLERWSDIGERTEQIVFHPTTHIAGKPIWESGVVACLSEPGNTWLQAGLFTLAAHIGEGGHLCPITCTSGLVRALQQKGSAELKARFLPGLLTAAYDRRLWGSQFLTEVQGGSDVGASIVRAVADAEVDGAYRIHGEKWFCSVADAPLWLVVARPDGAPEGTAGLACFVVPRHLDDRTPNGFALRRLKEKTGTRAMASGEIDFEGALAWPIGRLDEGFKIAIGIVLNTSRWMNALGDAGAVQRAWLEAGAYARTRAAFGGPIAAYPLVRETLARMKTEAAATLTSTMHVVSLVDDMDTGRAGEDEANVFRLLVNANKYLASITGTAAVRDGIEILGGNGVIETFSCLPRLWRDAIVLESWEGAHNVLILQILRDSAKLPLMQAADRHFAARRDAGRAADAALAGRLDAAWTSARAAVDRCLADPMGHGQMHMRRAVERLMRVVQTTLLLDQAAWEQQHGHGGDETLALARLHAAMFVDRTPPEDDPDHLARINAALGHDLTPQELP